MAKKLRVGILFGGRSGEHEVSLLSAASILKAIDRDRFDVVPIGITKEGRWLGAGDAKSLLDGDSSAVARRLRAGDPEATPGAKLLHEGMPTLFAPEPQKKGALAAESSAVGQSLDVVFPVLHGTFGEDGTIQGLFELAGLPIVKHVTLLRSEWEKSPRKAIARIEKALVYPLFIKPANLGSSVGISKAHNRKELGPALDLAAKYDRKLIVEQGVGGKKKKARELEVAVLGNDDPKASVVGEIIPGKEFYDYEAKYLSEGSVPVIPAKLAPAESKKIRAMAVEAFRACDLAGLARVDFLMDPDGKRRIYLNEVNTLPGFTQISMYPKLWEATGIGYTELITRLIELALERHAEKTRTTYSREE